MAPSWKVLPSGPAGMGREGMGMEVDIHSQVENPPAGALPNLFHGSKEGEIVPHLLENESTDPPQAQPCPPPEAGMTGGM